MIAVDKSSTRPATAAELFYPGSADLLLKKLDDIIGSAEDVPFQGAIQALISPHAGYDFSGRVAAAGYKKLAGNDFPVIAIIAPSHHEKFQGISVFTGEAYETPLGRVPVASEVAFSLVNRFDDIVSSWQGHRTEHAIEVQLPFLQKILPEFAIVPIVMGEQNFKICRSLGFALSRILSEKTSLIVASSDLSHYHSYETARKIDALTIEKLESLDELELMKAVIQGDCEACGIGPIITAMIASKGLGADKIEVLNYCNSGDVTGEHAAVVGYLSAVLYHSN